MGGKRIFEIDLLRCLAIILMITFHTVYDMEYIWHYNINCEALPWWLIGRCSALIFIIISGISSCLGKNSFKNGIKVFLCGMLITAATYFYSREDYIRFGILHFLGISMLLSPLLQKIRIRYLVLLALACFAAGLYIKGVTVSTFLLLPLGFMYDGFSTMDYYPILPYISYFILGIVIYKAYYYRSKSIFTLNIDFKAVRFISNSSLVIYLVHQPLILVAYYLFSKLV